MIRTAFDPRRGWQQSWPGSVSHHDVVFSSPVDDPTRGLPIGDGESGCLLWPEGDRLRFVINRCDLFDHNGGAPFSNWSAEQEEYQTSLRQAAQGEIQFGMPVFDLIYQSDYEARMSLSDACACFRAETPFSDVRIRAFYESSCHTLVIRIRADLAENSPIQATLSRWGSRVFAHWYAQVRRDPQLGLEGTQTDTDGARMHITQKLSGGAFCVSARWEGGQAERMHSRACRIRLEKDSLLYITVGAGETEAEARRQADAQLDKAAELGEEALYRRHSQAWRTFWETSMVRIPNDYLENLWYLSLYYANSSSRGRMPAHFCNGLWGFQHDFTPWNFYFHYNMQLASFPLHASGHPELLRPYLGYRAGQLPQAMDMAKRQDLPGALYTDVASADGAFDRETCHNLTPGPQIALMLYQHYEYTGDTEFLRHQAWPVIRECARMYTGKLVCEEGKWHIPAAQAYEGSYMMEDPVTDQAMLRVLLPLVGRVSRILQIPEPLAEVCDEIAVNLRPMEFLPLEEDEIRQTEKGPVIAGGIGEGKPLCGNGSVLSAGRYIPEDRGDAFSGLEDGEYWKKQPAGAPLRQLFITKNRKHYYGFPDVELAPVFPAGLTGLSRKSSPLFQALVNQARLHEISRLDSRLSIGGEDQVPCMGWCLLPIVLARLGLQEELARSLDMTAQTWQWYPNGLGHYGGYRDAMEESNLRFKTRMVYPADMGPGEAIFADNSPSARAKFPFPAWPFRHFDFETLPILAAAVNEMLLQSHEGAIRVFPACAGTASFRLHARGGFAVDAQRRDEGVEFVSVQAQRDGHMRLIAPWPRALCTYRGEKREMLPNEVCGEDPVYGIDMKAGERALFVPEDTLWQTEPENRASNARHKEMGRAMLGLPRMY